MYSIENPNKKLNEQRHKEALRRCYEFWFSINGGNNVNNDLNSMGSNLDTGRALSGPIVLD